METNIVLTYHAIQRYCRWMKQKNKDKTEIEKMILSDLKESIPIKFNKTHQIRRLLNHNLSECFYFLNQKKNITFTILHENDKKIILTIGSMRFMKIGKDVFPIKKTDYIYQNIAVPLLESLNK